MENAKEDEVLFMGNFIPKKECHEDIPTQLSGSSCLKDEPAEEVVQFVITEFRERNHKCPTCEMTFYEESHLRVHMVKHQKVQKFHCRQCFKSFPEKAKLTAHMKARHNVKSAAEGVTKRGRRKKKPSRSPPDSPEERTCKSGRKPKELSFKRSSDRSYHCDKCGEVFIKHIEIVEHYEEFHVW
ncbi:zinc finger protein 774-like [Lutzomyia longipalpis]|uniref:zinc finger protein 774-like n=1 Tax=Lutzomyia longipalpis TaxID=7200 RepID=UPI002483BAB0|nr:zinc finger protein 774-like [Lutzomyia longipalpis]